MKHYSLNKYFIIFITLFTSEVFAAPSAEIIQQLIQTDGSTVSAIQKGDEWNNWMETQSGYTIKKRKNGNWYYFMPETGFTNKNKKVNDSVLANLPPPINLQKKLRPKLKSRPTHAPQKGIESTLERAPTGNFNGEVLFILAEFSNQRGSTTESSWAKLISQNIADYYRTVSYNKVSLQPAAESYGIQNNGVVGWVNIAQSHPNTGKEFNSINQEISRRAIIAANPYVDYASYDKNNDNYVDSSELAVVVIVAGHETSYANYPPNIWAHAWSIFASPPLVDGVTVGAYRNGHGYAQFGELHRSKAEDRHQATMGIMVHELGHLIFGFPDLYDTDDSSSGIGAFGVMGYGSWGRKDNNSYSGTIPVFPTAWVQLIQGWINVSEKNRGSKSITSAASNTATSDNTVYKYATNNPNQYFLVQNRQNLGYDRGLERCFGGNFKGGIVIFHIDESQPNNSNDTYRLVDIEEADGTPLKDSCGSDSDFWRAGNATNFNSSSSPNSKLNNGSPTKVNINSISATRNVMTVNFGASNSDWLVPVVDLILN